jgi:hypothetical protein
MSKSKFPDTASKEFNINASMQVIAFFLGESWLEKMVFSQKNESSNLG